MYIERVPNRSSPPAILLRESFRKDGKVCKRTILNLTKWPPHLIEGLRALLKGGIAVSDFKKSIAIVRSARYAHVAAILGTLRQRGLDAILAPRASRSRDLACALIVGRVLRPISRVASVRAFDAEILPSSVTTAFGLGSVSADELDRTMDWLLERQSAVEARLVKGHLAPGGLALVTVSAFGSLPVGSGNARDSEIAQSRPPFGLLCNAVGCPVAVRVLDGDSAERGAIGPQLEFFRRHFGLKRVALVGDLRLPNDPEPLGWDWIISLRRPAIRQLVATGVVQTSLFDQRDLAEISNQDYPGQRLLLWRDPDVMRKRARRREESLQSIEARLEKIAAAVRRECDPLRGAGEIGLRIGMAIGGRKLAKCFELRIGERDFSYARKPATIAAEAVLDGLSAIRTSLAAEDLPAPEAVQVYQGLGQVEHVFRNDPVADCNVRVDDDSSAVAGASAALHAGLPHGVAHAGHVGTAAARRAGSVNR